MVSGLPSTQPDQLVLGRLRRHDHPRRATHRRAGRRAVEPGPDGAVQLGLGDERDVVHGHHHRHRRVQRHRVVGRVDQRGVGLLGDQRQAGLLPGQPGRPVRDRRRSGDHLGAGRDPREPLGVRALAHDHEVLAGLPEAADQPVDVATDAATVCGHGGRVDEHARRRRNRSSLLPVCAAPSRSFLAAYAARLEPAKPTSAELLLTSRRRSDSRR